MVGGLLQEEGTAQTVLFEEQQKGGPDERVVGGGGWQLFITCERRRSITFPDTCSAV